MDTGNPIIENIDNPHELERLFRKDPEAFKRSFAQAWEQNPGLKVLAVWYERLYFRETENTENDIFFQKDFLVMGIFAILAGICTRVILHFAEQQVIAPVNLVFGVLPFIAAYFVHSNPGKVSFTLFCHCSWFLYFILICCHLSRKTALFWLISTCLFSCGYCWGLHTQGMIMALAAQGWIILSSMENFA